MWTALQQCQQQPIRSAPLRLLPRAAEMALSCPVSPQMRPAAQDLFLSCCLQARCLSPPLNRSPVQAHLRPRHCPQTRLQHKTGGISICLPVGSGIIYISMLRNAGFNTRGIGGLRGWQKRPMICAESEGAVAPCVSMQTESHSNYFSWCNWQPWRQDKAAHC